MLFLLKDYQIRGISAAKRKLILPADDFPESGVIAIHPAKENGKLIQRGGKNVYVFTDLALVESSRQSNRSGHYL